MAPGVPPAHASAVPPSAGFRVGGRWKVLWVASLHVGRQAKLIQVAVGRRPSAHRLLDHQSQHGPVPSELPAFIYNLVVHNNYKS